MHAATNLFKKVLLFSKKHWTLSETKIIKKIISYRHDCLYVLNGYYFIRLHVIMYNIHNYYKLSNFTSFKDVLFIILMLTLRGIFLINQN